MYSPDSIAKLNTDLDSLARRRKQMLLFASKLRLKNPEAQRFLLEGVLRRASFVTIGIRQVFSALPPNLVGIPKEEDIDRATIALHSHFINVFGFLDCLAWVWVHENDIKKDNGRDLEPKQVSLFNEDRKCRIRNSLPQDTSDFFLSLNDWMSYLKRYRHSLAHQIPPYIPPSTIDPKHKEEFDVLRQGLLRERDQNKRETLERRVYEISHFKPFMLIDSEISNDVLIHYRILQDYRNMERCCLSVFEAIALAGGS